MALAMGILPGAARSAGPFPALFVAVLAASCSTSNPGKVCAPGATQACLGAGACAGAQVCNPDGSAWEACDCGPSEGGAGDGGAARIDGSAGPGQDGGPSVLVDDESSSLGKISLANGGYWYTYLSTGSPGTVTPTPGDPFYFTPLSAGPFSHAACFSGSGITGFHGGAGFAFQALTSSGALAAYDASAYSSISFYAMSPDTAEMTVFLAATDTDLYWPGATCAGGADAGPVPLGGYSVPPCGNPAGAIVPLTATWQRVSLAFANVSAYPSAGYYDPASVDSKALRFMDFQVENPNRAVDGGAPLSFQVCVAQVALDP